ncbi:MAG: peptide-methionine (S)-S-oxide reductase [Actinomycetota bacterium]|nr:peptide-methionine (S)-S-oxide reductase [Actinomycetota bacterium]
MAFDDDRPVPAPVPAEHAVLGTPLTGPWPEGTQVIYLALGCFWGAEKAFWETPGIVATAAGYAGGHTPHPTYEEVCTGRTGHAETVLVAYDPDRISTEQVLQVFWERHDPTQGNRQGNDLGTQYRSAVYWTTPEQETVYWSTREAYQGSLRRHHFGDITTEGRPAGPFFIAEEYHQQYLHREKNGYCPDHGTGVSCRIPPRPR